MSDKRMHSFISSSSSTSDDLPTDFSRSTRRIEERGMRPPQQVNRPSSGTSHSGSVRFTDTSRERKRPNEASQSRDSSTKRSKGVDSVQVDGTRSAPVQMFAINPVSARERDKEIHGTNQGLSEASRRPSKSAQPEDRRRNIGTISSRDEAEQFPRANKGLGEISRMLSRTAQPKDWRRQIDTASARDEAEQSSRSNQVLSEVLSITPRSAQPEDRRRDFSTASARDEAEQFSRVNKTLGEISKMLSKTAQPKDWRRHFGTASPRDEAEQTPRTNKGLYDISRIQPRSAQPEDRRQDIGTISARDETKKISRANQEVDKIPNPTSKSAQPEDGKRDIGSTSTRDDTGKTRTDKRLSEVSRIPSKPSQPEDRRRDIGTTLVRDETKQVFRANQELVKISSPPSKSAQSEDRKRDIGAVSTRDDTEKYPRINKGLSEISRIPSKTSQPEDLGRDSGSASARDEAKILLRTDEGLDDISRIPSVSTQPEDSPRVTDSSSQVFFEAETDEGSNEISRIHSDSPQRDDPRFKIWENLHMEKGPVDQSKRLPKTVLPESQQPMSKQLRQIDEESRQQNSDEFGFGIRRSQDKETDQTWLDKQHDVSLGRRRLSESEYKQSGTNKTFEKFLGSLKHTSDSFGSRQFKNDKPNVAVPQTKQTPAGQYEAKKVPDSMQSREPEHVSPNKHQMIASEQVRSFFKDKEPQSRDNTNESQDELQKNRPNSPLREAEKSEKEDKEDYNEVGKDAREEKTVPVEEGWNLLKDVDDESKGSFDMSPADDPDKEIKGIRCCGVLSVRVAALATCLSCFVGDVGLICAAVTFFNGASPPRARPFGYFLTTLGVGDASLCLLAFVGTWFRRGPLLWPFVFTRPYLLLAWGMLSALMLTENGSLGWALLFYALAAPIVMGIHCAFQASLLLALLLVIFRRQYSLIYLRHIYGVDEGAIMIRDKSRNDIP